MKLIELNASSPTFKPLKFNQTGLSLILGNKSDSSAGGSNGSGKTLALWLVHLCLGSTTISEPIKKHLPEWEFELQFSIRGKKHDVVRSGDGKKIALDGKKITFSNYKKWLNEQGIFRLIPDVTTITFRSLFSRFARRGKADWHYPEKITGEQDAVAILRTLYLLGEDPSSMLRKMQNKKEIDDINKALKTWKADPALKNLGYSGLKPQTQINYLKTQIQKLETDIKNFEIAENYRALETEANQKTEDIREIDKKIAQLSYEKTSIETSLKVEPDISRKELLKLYEGLEQIFKPEALAHLSSVEQFHENMLTNRRKRLNADRVRIEAEIQQHGNSREKFVSEREKILKHLHGKKALDEYAAVVNQLGILKEQCASLEKFNEIEQELERKKLELKQRMAADDALAAAYKDTNPLSSYNDTYARLIAQMYSNIASGLVLENNTGDNSQLRFNFKVDMEGSESEGLNAARIVSFDWLLFMYGKNHSMNFLWHDSSLFSDNDPGPRARWFTHALQALRNTGKQYIVSLTHENFTSMEEHLDKEIFTKLTEAKIIDLGNANANEKLLGITVAMS